MPEIKKSAAELNDAIDALRKQGASIDGDNQYKEDLLDCAVGAMISGVQNRNKPPKGHWGWRFWDIGREEAAAREELAEALALVSGCLVRTLRGEDVPNAVIGQAIATATELVAKENGVTASPLKH